jgi:hypothetical protein
MSDGIPANAGSIGWEAFHDWDTNETPAPRSIHNILSLHSFSAGHTTADLPKEESADRKGAVLAGCDLWGFEDRVRLGRVDTVAGSAQHTRAALEGWCAPEARMRRSSFEPPQWAGRERRLMQEALFYGFNFERPVQTITCFATEAYAISRRERKKVEMFFAHLRRIIRLDRLGRLGASRAKDEF